MAAFTVQAIAQNGASQDWATAFTVNFTAVPEPATVTLLILGAGLLLLRTWCLPAPESSAPRFAHRCFRKSPSRRTLG